MPHLTHRELTFGTVPCLVTTTVASVPIAVMYVIVAAGHALRPLVDDAGQIIELVSDDSHEDVLSRATTYLQSRFGCCGPPVSWPDLPVGTVRVVLSSVPFRPEDEF